MSESNPLRVSWELTTPAGIEETWALFSDTERFNRAVGFGFTFTETPLPDGTTRREGRARFLGMEVRWEELPFQYRYGQWYRWERTFIGSPASRMSGTLRLRPSGSGTAILYSIEVHPRSLLTRPIVALELNVRTKSRMDRILQDMLEILRGEPILLEPLADPLSAGAEQALQESLARMPDVDFSMQLGRFLREAPLPEQDRISPLILAREWEMPLQQAVQGCLAAVSAGALTLGWELLCPLCLGPKERVSSLDGARQKIHCPACNIHFDGAFADAVAISFRTAPALRVLEVSTACIGSPARQPHVIAQDHLPVGGEMTFALDLQPGLYRLRSFPPRDTCSISVGEGEDGPSGVEVVLSEGSLLPGRLRLGAGPATLSFSNTSSTPLLLLLERRTLPPDVLTAGQLLELPGAAALLPPEALATATRTETLRCAILSIELPGLLAADGGPVAVARQVLADHQPRRLQARDTQILATFGRLGEAITAIRALLQRVPEARVGLSQGLVLEVLMGADDWIPMGMAVERAIQAGWGAAPGQPALEATQAAVPEVLAALEAAGGRLASIGIAISPDVQVRRFSL